VRDQEDLTRIRAAVNMGDNPDPERNTQPGITTAGSAHVAATGTRRKMPRISLPQLLIAIGCAAVIVSLFLNWIDLHVSFGAGESVSRTANATQVPVQFLFDRHSQDDDPTILIALIPAAAVGLLGALSRQKALAFLAGGVSLFVAGMYAYQSDQGLGDLTNAASGVEHFKLNDVMGIAPYICGAGALLILNGAFVLDRGSRGDEVSEIHWVPPGDASPPSNAE
jgi:hypothetical protein